MQTRYLDTFQEKLLHSYWLPSILFYFSIFVELFIFDLELNNIITNANASPKAKEFCTICIIFGRIFPKILYLFRVILDRVFLIPNSKILLSKCKTSEYKLILCECASLVAKNVSYIGHILKQYHIPYTTANWRAPIICCLQVNHLHISLNQYSVEHFIEYQIDSEVHRNQLIKQQVEAH